MGVRACVGVARAVREWYLVVVVVVVVVVGGRVETTRARADEDEDEDEDEGVVRGVCVDVGGCSSGVE